MTIHATFLGAADSVTGSCFFLETPAGNILVDCGFFQGSAKLAKRNAKFEGLDIDQVDAVILTHAHLDHCGRLPLLANKGYRGPVFCTDATRELARVVMLDSAGIQEETARRAQRRKLDGKKYDEADLLPIYTTEDALDAIELLSHGLMYEEQVTILEGITAVFRDAGHILGSSFVELEIAVSDSETVKLTFSGDIGNLNKPIVRDPTQPNPADIVFIESTYGNRDHVPFSETKARFRELVEETVSARGCLLLPSFALERTQEILCVLHDFWKDGLLDRVPVYVDSPMAIDATQIFLHHPECYDEGLEEKFMSQENPFRWGRLMYTRGADESRRINGVDGPVIVIAGSGMCTGGRIVHHLRHRVGNPTTTVGIMGYQARGTIGRRLVEGENFINMFGQTHEVRARVVTVNGFSAHAGKSTLLDWYGHTGPARKAIVVHGEDDAVEAFSEALTDQHAGVETIDPDFGARIQLYP